MGNPAFLEDIYPTHLLYGITIRSTIAKGHVKMVQYPKLPDNYTIVTARNIPGENRLEDTSIPILAESELSYIGEPIAILLGQDKTKLEELVKQCKIIYDEETPEFNAIEPPAAVREIQIGDPSSVFDKPGKIIAGTYVTGIQDHWYAEPAGAVTYYKNRHEEKDEKARQNAANNAGEEKKETKLKKAEKMLIVKTATQWPYHVKRSVARALGIDQSEVTVETTSLSLHMDGKLMFTSLVACHSALGTYVTNKPVRLILNREEDFFYSPKRCKSNIDIVSVIDDKGNITATEADIVVNLGSYGVNSEEILDQVCLGVIGYYNIENLKISAKANISNIPPQGPFSGFGLAQGFFAMERHISQVADTVKTDPAQWRKSRINPFTILPSGVSAKNQISVDKLISSVTVMSDYYRKWASYELLRQTRREKSLMYEKGENLRGIGIALGFQGNGLLYHGQDNGIYSVEVTLTKDSFIEIKTSITSSDGDYARIWAKVVMDFLSIEEEKVRLITENAPDGGPSCASRNITVLTRLVEKCCQAIRKQRFHDPLPITVRRSVKPQYGSLWKDRFMPRGGNNMDISGFLKPGMAACVVEVSIDLVECIPRIRGVWLGIDGGKIISENRARRNITRGATQALGWAFAENIEYSEGALPKNKYDKNVISSYLDIPVLSIDFLSTDSHESKGIGELPFTCIPSAFLQAVSQAMDHFYKTIPIRRKEIWDIARLKNSGARLQGQK
ncbi:MAG: xanthine dehydrogenase family protein molybdopterin-binding subunit [Treponema sp.]|jgi:CO/xanthine dehydrogenase Mo-binding subunit|nr:xanthine dehydrogenase family protein molybdopterin-binding subunit [Treponema sp.]